MDNDSKKVVGTVSYYDSGETLEFTDPEKYLTEIKEAFYYRGINGWSYHTVSDDPVLKLAAHNIERDEYGLEPVAVFPGGEDDRQQANNRARISSDMPEIVRMLTELEQEMDGRPGQIGKWMRISYEINEDFDFAPAEQVQQICEALRDVRHHYGIDIARELYNGQVVVLPTEIRNAGHYLHHGGQFSHLEELAYHGILMDGYEDMDYTAVRELIDHMNGGGTIEEYQQQDDIAPAMEIQM